MQNTSILPESSTGSSALDLDALPDALHLRSLINSQAPAPIRALVTLGGEDRGQTEAEIPGHFLAILAAR